MKPRYQILTSQTKNFFFPENYPASVKSTYLGYMNYNLLLQFSSSALGVLSTQQLLLALGADSLTASAALNWILKDGLGQLGGILYAGTTGSRFDQNPKFYKWISALSINISCLIELITPLFPQYFLPIASIATVGKNISAMSGSASRAAIHLHFCKENNLADLTAKSSTQATAASLFGTFLGSFCGYYSSSYLMGASFFLGFSIVHLIACYKGLGYIKLNTLNSERLDIVLKEFLRSQTILTYEQVASLEKVLLPYKNRSVIIGSQRVFEEFLDFEKFIISKENEKVHLIYREDAGPADMISGYIKAKEIAWGADFSRLSICDLEKKGWNPAQAYLSPNNTRFRFLN